LIIPAAELSAAARARLAPAADDYAITRPRGRTGSKLVDRHVAEIVALFRTPRRVVDAVLAYSQAHGLDPKATLDGAFPVLRDCYNARLLVPEGSPAARQIAPSLERGASVLRWRIVRPVHVLEDVELYQVRNDEGQVGALKLLRPGWGSGACEKLTREAAALEQLAGWSSPRVLEQGTWSGDPYLVMSWSAGVSPLTVAAEHRAEGPGGRAGLLALCRAVVETYAGLHDRGVIHGDVHPGNTLIAPDGHVVLLDFGLALVAGRDDHAVPRGGVPRFLDPELAGAMLAGQPSPPATILSDLFGVGALLYQMLTGEHYTSFVFDERPMLEQIVRDGPRPFSQCGAAPWPDVEAVLRRVLAKRPGDRYPAMADFAMALREVPDPVAVPVAPADGPDVLDEVLPPLLQALATHGRLFREGVATPPTCSITYGAAGIAHALYRIASRTQNPATLALADSWAVKAEAHMDHPGAFHNQEIDVTSEVVGEVTPYHTASGVHGVRALIALAMSDGQEAERAVDAFVRASRGSGAPLDLTLGRMGTVIGCALLHDALPSTDGGPAQAVRDVADEALAQAWHRIGSYPPIGSASELITLGMAHGWAGILYATLRWCRAAARPYPPALEQRLDELAALAEPAGRGVRWPWPVRNPEGGIDVHYMPGWCQGTAGYVHLWTQAHRALGADRFHGLAERAAWNVWEGEAEVPTLCCGLVVGRMLCSPSTSTRASGCGWSEPGCWRGGPSGISGPVTATDGGT